MIGPIALRVFNAESLKVEVYQDHASLSRRASLLVVECLQAKPDAVLCLATGGSPELTYQFLAEEAATMPDVFAAARVVKLDEWLGLPAGHPATCETYLQEKFLGPCGISSQRYLGFKNDTDDPAAECLRVKEALAAWGGIDLAILGVGLNGHLGLNEPAEKLTPDPHVAKLTQQTSSHPMLQGHGVEVREGMTLGYEDLASASAGLLLVNGMHKRDILRGLLTEEPSSHLPASLLRVKSAYTCLCDQAAAGSFAGA